MTDKPPSKPITGIPTKDPKGRPYVRKDIDLWYKEQTKQGADRIQLTLFIEALETIQKAPLSDQLSFFRLAAIHSAPWVSWDGAPAPKKPNPDGNDDVIPGYCVHNDYTFPSWHRVYMTIFEQAIYETMIKFIDTPGKVPEAKKATWREEAGKWRLPFWDFARFPDQPSSIPKQNEVPSELRLPVLAMLPKVTINVTTADGSNLELKARDNPFYKYTTPKLMGQLDPAEYRITGEKTYDHNNVYEYTLPWDKCISTTKYGILDSYDESVWADGGQNWLRSNLALNEHAWYKTPEANKPTPVPTLQELSYRLFKYNFSSWATFSTTKYAKGLPDDKPKDWLSLEFIHNNIHNWVGGTMFVRPGTQDMKLWGAGHMGSVFMAAFDPIFWVYHCNIDRLTSIWQVLNPDKYFDDDESKKLLKKPLTPFHKDANRTPFTSFDVQDWRTLNFDYEMTQGDNPDEYRSVELISSDIENLYGSKTKSTFDNFQLYNGYEYVVNVIYDRYALNGAPYKINIFIGDMKDDEFQGPESKSFVGSIYNFSANIEQNGGGSCPNCVQQKKEGIKSVAQIPATLAAQSYLKDNSNNKDNPNNKEIPLYYVGVDHLGQRVSINPTVKLFCAKEHFFMPDLGRGGEDFEYVDDGQPAPDRVG